MTWNGRKLMSYAKNGSSITYKNDGNGLRTLKVIDGVKHSYYYEDGQLLYEIKQGTYELYYKYDADGRLALVLRKILSTGGLYYYYPVLNTRGDIIELYGGPGALTARYTYDSWGKLISVVDANGATIGAGRFAHYVSLRYRGYYYDAETELYYMQSRYFDPEVGRFLNADDVEYIGYSGENLSYNAFAYCENEPIRRLDVHGNVYTYADRIARIDWTSIIKDLGNEVLLSFLKNYLLKGFKIKEESIRIEYNEKTQMFNARVKYYKSNYNVNGFKVEYGDQRSWWNSTFEENLSSMGLAENYSGFVYDAGFDTATKTSETKIADIIIFTVLTWIVLAYNDNEAENYGRVYKEVWGMDGNGRSDKILFKISSEKQLNGYYLYNYSTQEGEEIEI